jgi:hypothetical protein
LFAPLAPHLADCRQLIVVPHDRLHYLPFHALHDGAGYLLERCQVTYAPTASLLKETRGQAPRGYPKGTGTQRVPEEDKGKRKEGEKYSALTGAILPFPLFSFSTFHLAPPHLVTLSPLLPWPSSWPVPTTAGCRAPWPKVTRSRLP